MRVYDHYKLKKCAQTNSLDEQKKAHMLRMLCRSVGDICHPSQSCHLLQQITTSHSELSYKTLFSGHGYLIRALTQKLTAITKLSSFLLCSSVLYLLMYISFISHYQRFSFVKLDTIKLHT